MQNISLLFCKIETKSVRCLLQGGGRGDAESAPDLCPWRGRKCCVCSVAATASALCGNVTAVALCKPSGEQSLRASPCLHFTSAPRWLPNTSLHAIMCWSCMHSHMHARLYVTCRTSFYSHSLVVVTWEIIFTGGPHKVWHSDVLHWALLPVQPHWFSTMLGLMHSQAMESVTIV